MDLLDIACHQTGHDAPGGLPALASKMGVNYQTLTNKLNPQNDTHKLTLREAVAMMLITGDVQILEAIAAQLDCRVVRDVDQTRVGLVSAAMRAAAEGGDVQRAIVEATSDGRLTARERAHIVKECVEARIALNRIEKELARD